MRRFTQLHLLTAYPPSNPNSDDLRRPKTATYGGVMRLRLSSQSIKRAARTGEVMRKRLDGHLGVRTRHIGEDIRRHLAERGVDEQGAIEIAATIAAAFGKVDAVALKAKPPEVRLRQLVFISPHERARALQWAGRLVAGEALPDDLNERVLQRADTTIDIAMFGRMLANEPQFNREAAVQVAHAITTHRASVEDDYFTAVDDLRSRAGDTGAGFLDDAGFGSGVYYLYACIDNAALVRNVDGAVELASAGVRALVEALATGSPKGRRNSYAHHARAGYIRAEAGNTQPRSLASAFLQPITGDDLMGDSAVALTRMAGSLDAAYGAQTDMHRIMDAHNGEGTLNDIQRFAGEQFDDA